MHAKQSLHTGFVSILGLLLVWGGLLSASGVARGQTSYEILHAFTLGERYPTGVIQDSAGTLYGATGSGGAADAGTVYKVDASGVFTVLHSFTGFNGFPSIDPYGGVIRDSAGNLYGTTFNGGAFGAGTVYQLDASGVFTILHSFDGSDGGTPIAGVIRDSAGNLYGTTFNGGAFGAGTVYKLDTDGRFTVLHSFNYSDGGSPFAGVIIDSAGNLYGATSQEGAFGYGTVYKLDTSGRFTILHSFNFLDGSDGAYPNGVIRDSAGTLYGTTINGGEFGGGTVYKVDASGRFTVLHSFNGSDGATPYAGVIRDSAGNLYGTTSLGGPTAYGVLYRLTLAPAALDCSTATASVDFSQLGNRHRYPVTISGITAPPGDTVSLTITSIFQDEPVVNPTGKTCSDGIGVGTAVAKVRNERLLAGDGRVYHIGFTATDAAGASCTGEAKTCVPAKEGEACGDQGTLFDSTVCP